MTIAQWQSEMAARPVPPLASIVERSTPVLSFGDPLGAEVATLGINPSRQEFYSSVGVLLAGDERRLATTDSLGAAPGQSLTADQARQVVADCNDYFQHNPYSWFKPLEALLKRAVVRQVSRVRLAKLHEVKKLRKGGATCRLFVGGRGPQLCRLVDQSADQLRRLERVQGATGGRGQGSGK